MASSVLGAVQLNRPRHALPQLPQSSSHSAILVNVDELVVSEAGGTRLRVDEGRWVLAAAGQVRPVEDAPYGLLPLLEREPLEASAALTSLGGPSFPYEALLLTALDSESSYWQEKAVPWLDALDVQPVGSLAAAARRACGR